MRIVCVDDHPIMLMGLTERIRQILPDALVYSFKRAEDALTFANENGCEVLISEIELSGTDGLTLAKRVKELNPEVNIIFLTVCDKREHAVEVHGINPSGYLMKPARKEQLELELKNLRFSACTNA